MWSKRVPLTCRDLLQVVLNLLALASQCMCEVSSVLEGHAQLFVRNELPLLLQQVVLLHKSIEFGLFASKMVCN